MTATATTTGYVSSLAPDAKGPPYRIDHWGRYEDDPESQRFVREHPTGATLEEVADALGLSHERVRVLEARALRALGRRMLLNRIGGG